MFERYSESARRGLFFARYAVTQLGGTAIHPERDRAIRYEIVQ